MNGHRNFAGDPLNELAQLTTAELKNRWVNTFPSAAPNLRRELLLAALSYQVQLDSIGSLPKRLARRLHRAAAYPDSIASDRPLPSGTRLIREWRGQTHAVEVRDGEFLWQGRSYASLSAIARAITGTRWSGPRFFGMEKRA